VVEHGVAHAGKAGAALLLLVYHGEGLSDERIARDTCRASAW
jgi:hypothetical protein